MATAEVDDSARRPKRRRIGYACDLCRAKKNRCDGERPVCGACKERRVDCVYPPQKSRPVFTEEYVENLKAQNRLLEEQLQRREQEHRSNGVNNHPDYGMSPPSEWRGSISFDSGQLDPNLSQNGYRGPVRQSVSFERGASSMQTASKPAGPPALVSPSASATLAPEVASVQSTGVASTPSEAGTARNGRAYFGESSTFNFLEKICSPATEEDGGSGSTVNGSSYPSTSLAASLRSGNPYDGLLSAAADDPFGLPHRSIADSLVDSYFNHRHLVNPYLHEGRFRQRYERIWLGQSIGGECATENTLAWLGLVNIIFSFGYDHDSDGRNAASVGRSRYFKRAQTLIFSGLLQSGTIELVQALLLMGQYYHNSLELDTCWTVVGLAIRVGQGLGLHLCPREATQDSVEQEVRRRTWWGCFIQDRLLSVKVGRRPTVEDPLGKVSYPLAVDDEYIPHDHVWDTPPTQPLGVSSKLAFFHHAIQQARLFGQIVDSLYRSTDLNSNDQGQNLSDLVARSIKLDGELVTWQKNLPPHLQFESDSEGWLWERQRSVLLMRFLGSRQLVHRQILLMVIARRIEDPFQNELVHLCVGRCVAAAYDTICQMSILQQRALMRSGWHNSHYVFTALCILVAFQTLDTGSRAQARLPESIDIPTVISRGMDILEKAGELHSLAIRYLEFVREWQNRLQNISARRKTSSTNSTRPDGSVDPLTEGLPLSQAGQPNAEALNPQYNANQLSMDVGPGFFDIENLFDPSTWFDMPYNWHETQQVK